MLQRRLISYLLVAIAIVMAVYIARLVTWNNLDSHAVRADYISTLVCVRMAAEGHAAAAQLYDLALEAPVEAEIMGPVSFLDGILPCNYPPYTMLLAAPLYPLPPGISFLIWDGIQILFLLIALYLLAAMLPPRYRYLLWLGAFAFLPVYHSILEGQTSPALLLGLTILWRGLRAGGAANWWAGLGLGLMLFKPQFLPLFLLYLLYRRSWRALAGFALVSAIAYLAAAIRSGFDWPFPYLNLINFLAAQNGSYGFYPVAMFNWRGLLVRLGLDNSALLLLLTALTVIAMIYAWCRSDHALAATLPQHQAGSAMIIAGQEQPQERVGVLELQLAITAIAAALTNLHLYDHDLTVLLFSGAALLAWAAQHQWPRWIGGLLLAAPLASLLELFGLQFDSVLVVVMLVAFTALLYLLTQPRLLAAPLGQPT